MPRRENTQCFCKVWNILSCAALWLVATGVEKLGVDGCPPSFRPLIQGTVETSLDLGIEDLNLGLVCAVTNVLLAGLTGIPGEEKWWGASLSEVHSRNRGNPVLVPDDFLGPRTHAQSQLPQTAGPRRGRALPRLHLDDS